MCSLKERTEAVKSDIGKITGEMKTNYNTLIKDVGKISDGVTSCSKRLVFSLFEKKKDKFPFYLPFFFFWVCVSGVRVCLCSKRE